MKWISLVTYCQSIKLNGTTSLQFSSFVDGTSPQSVYDYYLLMDCMQGVSGGGGQGGQLPLQYLKISVIEHLLVPPTGPSLFSTCPPNNFLPDTPLADQVGPLFSHKRFLAPGQMK